MRGGDALTETDRTNPTNRLDHLRAGLFHCLSNNNHLIQKMKSIGLFSISLLLFTQVMLASSIKTEPFGKMPDGSLVTKYTLSNDKGASVSIIDLGGTITNIMMPDREGKTADIVLGCTSVESYLKDSPYFGCITGRYCNRIGNAKFTLEGKEYTLAANNGKHHLHGGTEGFNKKLWTATPGTRDRNPSLALTYTSPDGEEGYPGALSCKVTYTLDNDNTLQIDYEATTDKTTVLSLTNHSYFNLAGAVNAKPILDHELTLYCAKYTPTDAEAIPTGNLADVKGTPLDFTSAHKIGERIEDTHEQMVFGKGYDHNFVIDGGAGNVRPAAKVYEPGSGRILEIHTTDVGIQFYTGNFLDGSFTGKYDTTYAKRTGFCLEEQRFPDSPNKPSFPSCVLKPGETYKKSTLYKFSAR